MNLVGIVSCIDLFNYLTNQRFKHHHVYATDFKIRRVILDTRLRSARVSFNITVNFLIGRAFRWSRGKLQRQDAETPSFPSNAKWRLSKPLILEFIFFHLETTNNNMNPVPRGLCDR